MLDKNELNSSLELYAKLVELAKAKVELEFIKVERLEKLQYEIASICEIKNKEGEIQANKVKAPLLMAIINELHFDKNNPKTAEYELMLDYEDALKKKANKDIVQGFVAICQELIENNLDSKEVFKEYPNLNKETLQAISSLVKEQYTILKNEKFGLEAKDNQESEAIKEELRKYLADKKEQHV